MFSSVWIILLINYTFNILYLIGLYADFMRGFKSAIERNLTGENTLNGPYITGFQYEAMALSYVEVMVCGAII